jgi:hypothetical protein
MGAVIHLEKSLSGYAGVALRSREAGVAQELLNLAQIGAHIE